MVSTIAFTVFRSDVCLCLNNGCNHVFSGLSEVTVLRSSRQASPCILKADFSCGKTKKEKKSFNMKWGPISEPVWGHVCIADWSPAWVFLTEVGVIWWWHKGALIGDCQLFLRWQDQFRKTKKNYPLSSSPGSPRAEVELRLVQVTSVCLLEE